MKIVPSSLCTFCGVHKETVGYLLINCAFTKDFWSPGLSWLKFIILHDMINLNIFFFVVFDTYAENHLINEIYFRIYRIRILRLKFPNS